MASCTIGIWPFGLNEEIRALLQPAADRGLCKIEEGPAWTIWTVHRGNELIAAANVRRTVEPAVEVVLVGGADVKSWIAELDRMIGLWAQDEGIYRMRAFGRKGWIPILKGWKVVRQKRGVTEYQRELANG